MRFHVLALPHTITRKDYSACAFTQKVLKFCKMMHQRGHTVFHYGHEDSEVEGTHITVLTNEDLLKSYGTYNWRREQFKHSTDDHAHKTFNEKASIEISKLKRAGDFLLLFWGHGHSGVASAHKDLIVVEPGIGCFNRPVAPFCVYESYAVMHYVYGKFDLMPRFMDCVIPNYFDLDDFEVEKSPQELYGSYVGLSIELAEESRFSFIKPGYVICISRLITSKGLQIAVEACKLTGNKLIIAGQGSLEDCLAGHKDFFATSKEDFNSRPSVWHVGYIEPKERLALLQGAKCLMCPTLYAEPFGGVNVEAQLCGIPVVSTDWGAFSETVIHGTTGFRCRTMDHFVWALKNLSLLDPIKIKTIARANYGLQKVASMYEEYFSMLQDVAHKNGFYTLNDGRLGLRWLEKVT